MVVLTYYAASGEVRLVAHFIQHRAREGRPRLARAHLKCLFVFRNLYIFVLWPRSPFHSNGPEYPARGAKAHLKCKVWRSSHVRKNLACASHLGLASPGRDVRGWSATILWIFVWGLLHVVSLQQCVGTRLPAGLPFLPAIISPVRSAFVMCSHKAAFAAGLSIEALLSVSLYLFCLGGGGRKAVRKKQLLMPLPPRLVNGLERWPHNVMGSVSLSACIVWVECCTAAAAAQQCFKASKVRLAFEIS